MAKIVQTASEKIYQIKDWKGLNENPNGDTLLKLGEAAVMRNFRVTRDGNLQRRPGSAMIKGLMETYTLSTASTAVAFRTDAGVSSKLVMYPTAAASDDGFVTLSGTSVTVEYDNYESYVNYYWQYSDYFTYKLAACVYDADADTYTWTGYLVTAVSASEDSVVAGLWSGNVGGVEYVMAACDGKLWKVWDGDDEDWCKEEIGDVETGLAVTMFGFSEKLYILNGSQYLEWDGEYLTDVIGYIPLVTVAVPPAGGGTTLEQVNKLTGRRRCWFSPDGESGLYQLPETNVASIDYVKDLGTGAYYIEDTDYTTDLDAGTFSFKMEAEETFSGDDGTTVFTLYNTGIVSLAVAVGETVLEAGTDYTYTRALNQIEFVTAPTTGTDNIVVAEYTCPVAGTDSLEVGWTNPANDRDAVLAMRYVEMFSGTTDNRVFIYGDGSNLALYSGLDYDGDARADYFPDLNVLDIGEANTPITGMIRHYSRLICFKSNSAYSVQYGTITLEDDSTIAAFYATPINRAVGNAAPGQVQLVLNSPRTLHGKDLFEWKNNSSYTSNLSIDERQTKRLSDRITATLGGFNFVDCFCWDDNDHQEYFICYDGTALVHNYAVDAWYVYTEFDMVCAVNFGGELYYGTSDGRLEHLSGDYRTNNGEAISAYWESGSMAFDAEHLRKYSAVLWIGMKPESNSEITVTIQTDRSSTYTERVVAASRATFANANFGKWTFLLNYKPQMRRLKIKAKKFVFYKLIFQTDTTDTTATMLAADIRVRYTGYAK